MSFPVSKVLAQRLISGVSFNTQALIVFAQFTFVIDGHHSDSNRWNAYQMKWAWCPSVHLQWTSLALRLNGVHRRWIGMEGQDFDWCHFHPLHPVCLPKWGAQFGRPKLAPGIQAKQWQHCIERYIVNVSTAAWKQQKLRTWNFTPMWAELSCPPYWKWSNLLLLVNYKFNSKIFSRPTICGHSCSYCTQVYTF